MKLPKIFLTALLLALSINIAYAETLIGYVVGITDGDTITVLDNANIQYKIRLAGIDAPERKQDFGKVSKKTLSDMVYDKQVTVDFHKQDRYGRIIGKVLVGGMDVNLEQIKQGMAWFYKKYQNEMVLEDRLAYLHAQQEAEKNLVGLWAGGQSIAPWDFRRSARSD